MSTHPFDEQASKLQDLLDRVAAGATRSDARIRWSDGSGASAPPEPEPEPAPAPAGLGGEEELLLVKGACLGDERALEALCRSEWYGVFSLVLPSVIDVVEAEELTQEIFSQAIAGLSGISYMGVTFRSYLAQIARNVLRDRWLESQGGADQGGDAEASPVHRQPVPETIVLAAEERHLLVSALSRLPSRCNEVLRLRLLEGRTATEIGAEWGRTPEMVHRVQRHAFLALQSETTTQGAG